MVLMVFGLGVAVAYFWKIIAPVSTLRSVLKTAPLVLFAGAAVINGAPLLLALGLAFSAVGDFALSRDGKRAFLAGLIAFALAHILYIVLFLLNSTGLPSILPTIAVLALAASTAFWLLPHTGTLRWPVCVYVGLISAMMIAALTLDSHMVMVILGAVLFVLSDVILSVRVFRLSDGHAMAQSASIALWVFYIAGQALIFWGMLGG